MIGGRNISSEYFVLRATKADAFHDTDLGIDSTPVAKALTRTFETKYDSKYLGSKAGEAINLVSRRSELLGVYRAMDAWLRAGPAGTGAAPDEAGAWRAEIEKLGDLRGALHRAEPTAFEAELRVLDSPVRVGGATTDDPITEGLVRLVESARHTILIQSPYLVLSKEGAEVLAGAGRRGVATTILTNSPVSSDNALSQAFFLEQWPEILARVTKLRLFVAGREHNLHDKIAVFDDELALVGTYNLDPTSMALNSEVVAAAWSAEFARAVAKEPRRIIAAGSPNVYEYTIARDGAGNPTRDADGHLRITFGPRDHCTPEQWVTLGAYWTTLKAVKEFTGFSPLF
jgi:putative cardiolipin synthase